MKLKITALRSFCALPERAMWSAQRGRTHESLSLTSLLAAEALVGLVAGAGALLLDFI